MTVFLGIVIFVCGTVCGVFLMALCSVAGGDRADQVYEQLVKQGRIPKVPQQKVNPLHGRRMW